ncbi:MAG: L,D-transpeptidase family protein [Parcubacteria group bacterium]|jgi:lipoprotein-anchoring transpeptidase ErfK/SrfK
MEFNEFVEKRHWYSSFWADVVWVLLGALALLFIFGTQYATGEFGYSAKIEKSQIKANESAIVDFSQPVASKAVEKNFEISPNMEVGFVWSNNYQKLEIRPAKTFEAGKTYTVKIDPQTSFSVSSLIGKKTEPLNLSFQVESPPQVVSMTPLSGDPNVKIDSKIKISFDKTTNGYDVNFVVEPFSNFDISFDDARKNFTIAPKGNLDFARDYAISVKIAPSLAKLSAKDMSEAYRANFKTEPSPPPPPPVEEVVLPEKTNPNEVATAQVATPEAKIKEGKYIDLNLAKQQLSIFENGERLGTYKVSTGKKGMATPTGTFHVQAKRGRAWSKKYSLYMPYFMQFTGQGHGIHELPEWKNGYKEGANHLGIPVSHGCVRLGVGPAAKVYNWSDVGTPIVIHY